MFDYLHVPAVLIVVCVIVGLCVGSFLNVVIHRLPKMLENRWRAEAAEFTGQELVAERFNLAVPRSRCPHCGHLITALENVPLFSYLFLRGRCSHCQARISLRYPVIEVLTATLSGLVAAKTGFGWACLGSLLFVWAAVALTFIDLDTFLLPDDITLPLLWLGLIFNLAGVFTNLDSAVLGAIVGYLALWSVFWVFKLITGKEGMGYGDFKLLAAIGAWFGWQALPMVILLSSAVGALVGITLILFAKHGRDKPIPFGPYLAAAGLLTLFVGDSLRTWLLPGA